MSSARGQNAAYLSFQEIPDLYAGLSRMQNQTVKVNVLSSFENLNGKGPLNASKNAGSVVK